MGEEYEYVQSFGIYLSIPLFYLQFLMSSFVFKYMSVRTCTRGTQITFNKILYNTNHQLHIGLVSSGSSVGKLEKALLTQLKSSSKHCLNHSAKRKKNVWLMLLNMEELFISTDLLPMAQQNILRLALCLQTPLKEFG